MNKSYHINILTKTNHTKTSEDCLIVDELTRMYPSVMDAMDKVVVDGDYNVYCNSIKAYDSIVWQKSHEPDKSNLLAYKKIKITPSWTEQLWAPIFERARRKVEMNWVPGKYHLVLLQNTEVAESDPTGDSYAKKDVDLGIGITSPDTNIILPVIYGEGKTGHYCKAACTGVDAAFGRVREMNPDILTIAITDNNISVSKTAQIDHVFRNGDMLIVQRGNNRKKQIHPLLDYIKMELVETSIVKYLSSKKPENFLKISAGATSGVYLLDSIQSNGHYLSTRII